MRESANYLREHRIAYIQLLAGLAVATTLCAFVERALIILPAYATLLVVIATADEIYQYIYKKLRELRRRDSARNDRRRFWLVLHSFEHVELVEGNWQWRWVDPSDGNDPNLYLVADSVINRLEDAIADERAIVCIGSEFPTTRSLVLSNTNTWFDIFTALLPRAEAVVLFPAESDGIRREMEAIVDLGAYRKVIVFMTPQTDWAWDSDFHHRAEAWTRAKEALKRNGFHLPEYQSTGMLFTVHPDFSPQTARPLGTTNYRYDLMSHHEDEQLVAGRVREVLASLRMDIPDRGCALCDSFRAVEQIERRVLTRTERLIHWCLQYVTGPHVSDN